MSYPDTLTCCAAYGLCSVLQVPSFHELSVTHAGVGCGDGAVFESLLVLQVTPRKLSVSPSGLWCYLNFGLLLVPYLRWINTWSRLLRNSVTKQEGISSSAWA